MNATANSVDPVDVARAAFRSVAAGHLDHFTELLHGDVVFDVVPVGLRRGRQAVRRYFEEVRLAMPDLVMTMEHAVGDDRYAAVEWRMTGTFDGAPYQGLAPTKRHTPCRVSTSSKWAPDASGVPEPSSTAPNWAARSASCPPAVQPPTVPRPGRST